MKVEIKEGFPEIKIVIECSQASDEIRKVEAMLLNIDQKISGIKENQTYLLEIQDILYFDTVDRKCFIYTVDDVYETPLKLYEIEALLSNIGFFRSSKSQIVNIAKISSLCPDFGGRIETIMENREKLVVSRQYAKMLKERLGLL